MENKEFKSIKESEIVQNMHRNQNLEFQAVNKYRNWTRKSLIYKSPSYNRQQSSSYYLCVDENDNAYYMRVSNHWGRFSTKSGEIDTTDPYGRRLSVVHNWELVGGQRRKDGGYKNVSQYGVIKINIDKSK